MINPDAYFFDKLITDLQDKKSRTYLIVKNTLKSQGHWKNKARGIPQKPAVLNKGNKNLAAASIPTQTTHQVSDNSESQLPEDW